MERYSDLTKQAINPIIPPREPGPSRSAGPYGPGRGIPGPASYQMIAHTVVNHLRKHYDVENFELESATDSFYLFSGQIRRAISDSETGFFRFTLHLRRITTGLELRFFVSRDPETIVESPDQEPGYSFLRVPRGWLSGLVRKFEESGFEVDVDESPRVSFETMLLVLVLRREGGFGEVVSREMYYEQAEEEGYPELVPVSLSEYQNIYLHCSVEEVTSRESFSDQRPVNFYEERSGPHIILYEVLIPSGAFLHSLGFVVASSFEQAYEVAIDEILPEVDDVEDVLDEYGEFPDGEYTYNSSGQVVETWGVQINIISPEEADRRDIRFWIGTDCYEEDRRDYYLDQEDEGEGMVFPPEPDELGEF